MQNSTDSEERLDSEEYSKFKGCLKKNFYDTWWEATHQAAISRDHSKHDNIYAYKCHFCLGWHVGHRRLKNGQKVVKRKPNA